jgi:hypothetical protein
MAVITESKLKQTYGKSAVSTLGRSTQRKHARYAAKVSVFLSHSRRDRDLALLVKEALESQGIDVYVDWLDEGMPIEVTPETARLLRARIDANSLLLLLATNNALESRWVPWELGYADGKHGHSGVGVLPVQRRGETYSGNEYLGLYRELSLETSTSGWYSKSKQASRSASEVSIGSWLRSGSGH